MSDSKPSFEIRESLSPLKQAFLALEEAEQRIRQLEQQAAEPIAIVGMGCRFPLAEDGPESYWRLMRNRACAVRDGVEARLGLSLEREHLPQQARWAALLERVDLFDPRHFGIAPREAAAMDPQQRLLLEVSWEALEDAGIDPFSLYQTRTGVFVGIASHDYAQLAMRHQRLDQIDQYFAAGGGASVAAGRISYVLGLNGPALSVDTACSSSLVAVHLACEALRRGECSAALAGGVNLILSPESCAAFAQAGMLSPRGVCAAFDDGADGFVRGEGCGVVVLKRLQDAEAAGDRVAGVILGSAVNQDGASSGLTVPNGLAQQALLREAHRRAGIEARQVGYVEAHGTGTRLGDPIEAEALGAVFGGREGKLAIGSVKSNIGHLESAAGVAGLMRLVLSLEHGEIPGQVHWQRPSSHVRWEELPLEVVTEGRAWEPVEGRRIGGVSSFGFSGTNAHVVVEGRSREAFEEQAGEDVLVISARTQAALRELAGRYAEYLEANEEWSWAEICHTSGVGRAEMSERLAVVAGGGSEAAGKLRAWLRGEAVERVFAGHVGAGQRSARKADAHATPEQIAEAYVQGAKVSWEQRRSATRLRRARLPRYAFQRERYWIEERKAETAGEASSGALLGRRLHVAGVRGQYEARLESAGWIGEHEVEGEAVLPATGHIELMLEAGAELEGSGCVLEELSLEARLGITGERRVQVAVEQQTAGRSRVRLYAEREDGEWERVSEGWLRPSQGHKAEREDIEALRGRLQEKAVGETFYAEMAERGMRFGERFRGVERLWSGEGEALGEIAFRTAAEGTGWQVSPWWLDACLQVVGAAAGGEGLYLPVSAERLELYGAAGERSWSHVRTRWLDAATLVADVAVLHPDGSPLARISGLRFRKVASQQTDIDSLLYRVQWERADGPSAGAAVNSSRILVLGESEQAFRLSSHLDQLGVAARHSAVDRWIAEPDGEKNDCVIWVESPGEGHRSISDGAAVEGIEAPIRSLLSTAQRLAGQRSSARLYVTTTRVCNVTAEQSAIHLAHSPLSGMAAAIAVEFPESRCTLLDVEGSDSDVACVTAEVLSAADDHWVAWRSGTRYAGKLERLRPQLSNPSAPSPVRLQTPGGIDALSWGATVRRDLQPDEVEIQVQATALNFHDVLQVLGVIPDEGPLGTDCAGIVLRTGDAVTDLSPGDAVVAVAPGCFATHAIAPRSLVARKPAVLSFAEAAGQTVAYLTAAWCLEQIAHIRTGETVLVHAAAGGVGLAAVHLCRRIGAEVIATAGNEAKREYLRSLGIQRVYDSRSLEFASHIKDGVDVVLNSLAGAAIDRALSLLKPGGRFVEMGRTDIRDPHSVASAWPNVQYVPVDLTPLFAAGTPWVRDRMTTLFKELEKGELPGLPVTVFPSAQVKEAFRYMARAAHTGRVVVESGEDFSGAHIVTGGMRGVGLAVAEWLARSGAQTLVLTGRSEPAPEVLQVIERIRDAGTTVEIVQGDIADPAVARKTIDQAGDSLRGIWHAASVLENLALEDQTWESMERVLRPKAEGAWNLHLASAGRRLGYFVLFSSWASIGGSQGQVNYCAANSFLDGVAAFRHAQGLAALSVNWGAWQGVGLTAAAEMQQRLARAGMESMSAEEALDGLRSALAGGHAQVAVANLNWPRYLAQHAERRHDPFYANFASSRSGAPYQGKVRLSTPESSRTGSEPSHITQSPVASEAALLRVVGDTVRRTLAFHEQEEIDPDVPLGDLGMDSLLAVDLRNSLANALERQLPSTLLFDYPTMNALMGYLSAGTRAGTVQEEETEGQIVPAMEPTARARNSLAFLAAIEQMSDDQVEVMIEKHSRV